MVVKPLKATTKFRLIYNGAWEQEGKCINDLLDPGYNLMNSIYDVLIRFRYHKYVYTGDVQKMFLQILVKRESRKYLRFIWRDRQGNLRIVEPERHLFGLTCSPHVSNRTVRDCAGRNLTSRPLGAKAIIQDIVVDDVLTGHEKKKGIIKNYHEVKEIFSQLNMKIHKFATNCPELRDLIPCLLYTSPSPRDS